MGDHYNTVWRSYNKINIRFVESKMETCLLKLAASWVVAPCFLWQGFHLHKQDAPLKEMARCQKVTYLDFADYGK